MARKAGGEWNNDTLKLPAGIGSGFIKYLTPEPGLILTIHHYTLEREFTLQRPADGTRPETLLISFHAFAPIASVGRLYLSTAQIASAGIEITTTLPAETEIILLALAINKSLLASWVPGAEEVLPALFTSPHPTVLDTLLTPEIQYVLGEVIATRPEHPLDAFFYKIKTQELLYWLFRALADRTSSPRQIMHPADVEKIFQVRSALLVTLNTPPTMAALAATAGLSQTKMRKLFRQIFGTSLYEYYQMARMEEARRLLGYLSVSEVGYRLGFTNLSHFSRLFARYHHITPKKYQAADRQSS